MRLSCSWWMPPSRFHRWPRCRRRATSLALFRSKLRRRFARHDDADLRSRARSSFQIDPATHTIGHDVVDDVQSEAGAALVAPGREKGVEHLAPDLRAHAAAVVRKQHFNIVLARHPRCDLDGSTCAVWKGLNRRIEDQVGEYLAIRAGIAVHGEIGLAFDVDRQLTSQPEPQSFDNLFGHLAEIKVSAIRNVAIGRNLLERLYQLDRVTKIDHDLRRRLPACRNKFSQGRPAHIAADDIGFKSVGLVDKTEATV